MSELSTAQLLSKSQSLSKKLKEGTATNEDKETFVRVTHTLEASRLDTATLLSKNAKIVEKMKAGTATRDDKVASDVLLSAASKQKETIDKLHTAKTADLIKRSEAVAAAYKSGTAMSRAEKEAFMAMKKILSSRKKVEDKAKTGTTEYLLKRHESLAAKLKTSTATRGDKEELEAVMKRIEELRKEANELESAETKRKLATAKRELHLTERRTEIQGLMKLVRASEKMDLVFMVDATGSMSAQIGNVKTEVVNMASKVSATNINLKLRTAAVFYRDAQDGDGGNETIAFVDELSSFQTQVGRITAFGGGDGCEDVASGLRDVMRLEWASPSRVLIHIADAPSHGERYNSGCNDHHPSGDHGIPTLLKTIKSMNVEYVFGKMTHHTDQMISAFNADVGCNWIKTAPMASAAELATAATATMRTTMHKTFSRLSAASTRPAAAGMGHLAGIAESGERAFALTETVPDWGALSAQPAEVYRNKPLGDLSKLCSGGGGALGWIKDKAAALIGFLPGLGEPAADRSFVTFGASAAAIKVAPQPFAEGNLRFARKGQLQLGTGGAWVDVVLKDYKKKSDDASKETYLRDMESGTIASALAKAFNAKYSPPPASAIRYVESPVLSVTAPSKERCYFVEEVLPGVFTKYSNNLGYWNPETLDEWLLRFSLFTSEATGGHMMVADLQGVRTADGYVLTDPVVLCKDEMRFGSTNMGSEAMERVTASAHAHLAEMGRPAA